MNGRFFFRRPSILPANFRYDKHIIPTNRRAIIPRRVSFNRQSITFTYEFQKYRTYGNDRVESESVLKNIWVGRTSEGL